MPNRIIRDGINSSSRMNSLSPGAEILYRRLMSVVDDFGRYYAAPATIRGACWPTAPEKVSEAQIIEWIGECSKQPKPLILIYYIDGCMYLEITDFKQQTRSKSKFPDPCLQNDINPISSPHQSDIKVTSLVVVRSRISETESEACGAPAAPPEIKQPPNSTAERIRRLADAAPDPQDFRQGIEMAVQEVISSANPESTLGAMEENIPLWWAAMRDNRARMKPFRFVIADRDYLRKPREPTKAKSESALTPRQIARREELMRD